MGVNPGFWRGGVTTFVATDGREFERVEYCDGSVEWYADCTDRGGASCSKHLVAMDDLPDGLQRIEDE